MQQLKHGLGALTTRTVSVIAGGAIGVLLVTGCPTTAANRTASPAQTHETTPSPAANDEDTPSPDKSDNPSLESKLGEGIAVTTGGDLLPKADVIPLSVKVRTTPGIENGSRPANGYFLVFTVELNGRWGKFDIQENDFYVLTPTGQHIETGDGNSSDATSKETLGHKTLGYGDHLTSVIAFDAPGRHGTLVYAPNSTDMSRWTF
jgi:hypothetical protein